VLFIVSFRSGSWPIGELLSVELNVPVKLAISETWALAVVAKPTKNAPIKAFLTCFIIV
jgi:hypothetical protein